MRRRPRLAYAPPRQSRRGPLWAPPSVVAKADVVARHRTAQALPVRSSGRRGPLWAPPSELTSIDLPAQIYDLYGPPLRADIASLPSGVEGLPDYPWGGHEYSIGLNPTFPQSAGAEAQGLAPWLPTNDPVNNSPGPYGCYQLWGEAFEGTTSPGNVVTLSSNANLRVHVANWTIWTLSALGGIWNLLWTVTGITGSDYNMDFAHPTSFGGIRNESYGWSFAFTPGVINRFWDSSSPRQAFPSVLGAIHSRFQARLITDDPTVDVTTKYVLLGGSLDFYASPSGATDIPDPMVVTRHKRLTNRWQWFTATDLSEPLMEAYPPPVFGIGFSLHDDGDSGSGLDLVPDAPTLSNGDTGTGTEGILISVTTTSIETGRGLEPVTTVAFVSTDLSSAGVDSQPIPVALVVVGSDTSSGTDAGESTPTALASSDSGFGSDAAVSAGQFLFLASSQDPWFLFPGSGLVLLSTPTAPPATSVDIKRVAITLPAPPLNADGLPYFGIPTPPSPPTVFGEITDEFSRPDNLTNLGNCDQGFPWIQSGGSWGISSNQAYTSVADFTSNSGAGAIAYIDHGWSDGTISIDVSALDTIGADDAGTMFRWTDSANFWILDIIWDNNTSGNQYAASMQSVQGGFFQPLAFYTLLPVGTGPWTIKATLVGSAISVDVNGSPVGSTVDAFNQTATVHGLNISSSGGITARLDNYVAIP